MFFNTHLVSVQISTLFSGAINGVGTITNAVASGVSSGVVGTVGAVSDGVDAVAYGVSGGCKDISNLELSKTIDFKLEYGFTGCDKDVSNLNSLEKFSINLS